MRETRVDKSLMNRPFIVEMYLRLSPRALASVVANLILFWRASTKMNIATCPLSAQVAALYAAESEKRQVADAILLEKAY